MLTGWHKPYVEDGRITDSQIGNQQKRGFKKVSRKMSVRWSYLWITWSNWCDIICDTFWTTWLKCSSKIKPFVVTHFLKPDLLHCRYQQKIDLFFWTLKGTLWKIKKSDAVFVSLNPKRWCGGGGGYNFPPARRSPAGSQRNHLEISKLLTFPRIMLTQR